MRRPKGRAVGIAEDAAPEGGEALRHPDSSPPVSTTKVATDGPGEQPSVVSITSKKRILLVEDHVILRDGLRALLELESDLQIVGAVGDAAAALVAVPDLQPHVVITDVALPGRSGIDLVRELVALTPPVRTIVLTAHGTEEYIRAALNAGAHGYVLKDSGRAELLHAIRSIVAGKQYLCAAVAAKVVSGFVSGREPKPMERPEDLVTERERQVLTRIALGQSNKLIARELGLSVKTVEKHRANLMRKLTLHNAAAVTLFALRRGFIDARCLESGAVPSETPRVTGSETPPAPV
jgi:DNA-binding NarL/FixJ family response regulator